MEKGMLKIACDYLFQLSCQYFNMDEGLLKEQS